MKNITVSRKGSTQQELSHPFLLLSSFPPSFEMKLLQTQIQNLAREENQNVTTHFFSGVRLISYSDLVL